MGDGSMKWLALLAAGLTLGLAPALAQTSAPQTSAPSTATTPTTPATPAPSATSAQPTPATPPAAPPVKKGDTAAPVKPAESTPGDSSATQPIEVAARPVLFMRGASNWDDGFKKIAETLARVRSAALKAGLKEAGRPLAAFVDTDDNGFKFEAMIPIEAAPAGAADLPPDVAVGTNPSGKALKFQHRGAYDDIDSTYEAITAYLDEKGLEARNVFVEEYLNDASGADDANLALDIYVFIK